MQMFMKTILTLSCWYSLDSSRCVLSDEYPYARVSVIFQGFLHHFVLAKLASSSIRVNTVGIELYRSGFDFPRGPGAYAPRF